MAKQLLGKEVTAALNEKIKANVAELEAKGVKPTLGIIRVGEREDDLSYERGATKRCETLGVAYETLADRDVVRRPQRFQRRMNVVRNCVPPEGVFALSRCHQELSSTVSCLPATTKAFSMVFTSLERSFSTPRTVTGSRPEYPA